MRRIIAALPSVIFACISRQGSDAFVLPNNVLQLRGSISMSESSQLIDDNHGLSTTSTFTMQREATELVLSFISTLDIERKGLRSQTAIDFFDDSIEFTDSSFYKPIIGKDALARRVMESPNSLLHLNGTFYPINVEGIATNADSVCDEDVKVAVLYNMQDEDGSSNSRMARTKRGITFYTVCESKITNLFDVKESSVVDSDWEKMLASATVVKGEVGKEFKGRQIVDAEVNVDVNVVSAFFKARNLRDLNATMGMLSDDCSLKNAGMDLLSLPDAVTFQIEDMITPSPDTNSGEVSVAVRWAIGVHGQRQRFSRGCSFFTVKDARITSIIDICESAKQEEFESDLGISPSRLNWLRDYGGGRAFVDGLVYLSLPSLIKENPGALATFAGLTRGRVRVEYGEHSGQFIDLFLPPDESKRRGLVFFVHGGAWGSGMPWMYRLAATPFLEANMAVAIVGYRTYPDGNVQDQVDDLESASRLIATKYPHLSKRPDAVDEKEWIGVSLMGHSSGAHIAMLKLVQRIERWMTNKETPHDDRTLHFDTVVGLSGVCIYSVNDHFDVESGRGIEELSPMKPACGYTMDSFNYYSPAMRLMDCPYDKLQSNRLPDVLLVHGIDDDTVPFTSAYRAAKVFRGWGYSNLETKFLKSTGHQDLITHLMYDKGETKDVVMNWLQQPVKFSNTLNS